MEAVRRSANQLFQDSTKQVDVCSEDAIDFDSMRRRWRCREEAMRDASTGVDAVNDAKRKLAECCDFLERAVTNSKAPRSA